MTTPSENKALVLKAFDTLFNKRDYEAAARFWSHNYIQHSAHIPPGRDGLFNLVKASPPELRYENAVAVADAEYVLLHGRFNSGLLGPTNLLDVGPTIRVSPSRRLTVMVGAPVFWRQSLADGVYLITTAPVPQSARSQARFVGVNPDVALAWQIDRHVQVTALFSHFFVGPFLRDTTPARAVNYGFTALSYRF